jgi:hypothetical protein
MITRTLPDEIKEGVDATMLLLNKRIAKRRELWSDRKEALTWMSKRSPWQEWDARVLELFVVSGSSMEFILDSNPCIGLRP